MITIDLTGKVALVVGGSRGIGGSITYTLARAGAIVVFTHTGNTAYAKNVHSFKEKIRSEKLNATGEILNATDYEGTKKLVSKIISEKGHIDILVHNAGLLIPKSLELKTPEEWSKVLDVNLTSAFYSVQAVMPHMVKNRTGRIIIIGSSAVYTGGGDAIDYAGAKSGLTGIVMYLAKNYAKKGINTNIIHPCLIETDMLKIRYNTKDKLEELRKQVPVNRLGKPEDIAYLVLFLVSSMGDYICGQSILVDGGRTFFQ